MEVGHLSDNVLLLAATSVVREDASFSFSINKKPSRTYSNFLERARNYINSKALASKNFGAANTSRGDSERGQQKEKKRLAKTSEGGSHRLRDEK